MLTAVPAPSASLCVCAMSLGIKKRQFVIKTAVSFSNEVFIHADQINTTRNGASWCVLWKHGWPNGCGRRLIRSLGFSKLSCCLSCLQLTAATQCSSRLFLIVFYWCGDFCLGLQGAGSNTGHAPCIAVTVEWILIWDAALLFCLL